MRKVFVIFYLELTGHKTDRLHLKITQEKNIALGLCIENVFEKKFGNFFLLNFFSHLDLIAVVRICDLPVTWLKMSDTPAKPSQVTYLSLPCTT